MRTKRSASSCGSTAASLTGARSDRLGDGLAVHDPGELGTELRPPADHQYRRRAGDLVADRDGGHLLLVGDVDRNEPGVHVERRGAGLGDGSPVDVGLGRVEDDDHDAVLQELPLEGAGRPDRGGVGGRVLRARVGAEPAQLGVELLGRGLDSRLRPGERDQLIDVLGLERRLNLLEEIDDGREGRVQLEHGGLFPAGPTDGDEVRFELLRQLQDGGDGLLGLLG